MWTWVISIILAWQVNSAARICTKQSCGAVASHGEDATNQCPWHTLFMAFTISVYWGITSISPCQPLLLCDQQIKYDTVPSFHPPFFCFPCDPSFLLLLFSHVSLSPLEHEFFYGLKQGLTEKFEDRWFITIGWGQAKYWPILCLILNPGVPSQLRLVVLHLYIPLSGPLMPLPMIWQHVLPWG